MKFYKIWAFVKAFTPLFLLLVFIIAAFFGMVYLLGEIIEEINRVGLKAIVESLWYGTGE